MERVGALGERLFEPTVDAEPFEGGGQVAGGAGGPELAGRALQIRVTPVRERLLAPDTLCSAGMPVLRSVRPGP